MISWLFQAPESVSMDRKKVLYLITKATAGGAQRYVYDLATHLAKETFEPVLAYGLPGKLSQDAEHAGIRSIQLPSLNRDVSIVSDVKSFSEILKCVRTEHPHVVHLNSSKAAALGALAARIAHVPRIIFTVHGWPFGEKRNFLAKLLIWKISWLTALLSHKVICVSEYDLKIAHSMPFIGKKSIRIYNGIGPMSLESGDVIRKAFPEGVHVTGTVGELTANKNHITLLEQAKSTPNMYVAIVGDGELRTMLEQKILAYGLQERVKLFGYIPAREVLNGFDTFALLSLKEGLPYVLLEAKQAGLPIAAHRVGGVGEILDKQISEFSLEKMVSETVALY